MQYESERIEYKSQMIEDLYREVIAFANSNGGVIYIGIDDQGNLTGIDNVDETYTRITNGIRDAIAPDVTMFVRYILQDNKVFQIEGVISSSSQNEMRSMDHSLLELYKAGRITRDTALKYALNQEMLRRRLM